MAFYTAFYRILRNTTTFVPNILDKQLCVNIAYLPLVVCSNAGGARRRRAGAAGHGGVVMGVAYMHVIWPRAIYGSDLAGCEMEICDRGMVDP